MKFTKWKVVTIVVSGIFLLLVLHAIGRATFREVILDNGDNPIMVALDSEAMSSAFMSIAKGSLSDTVRMRAAILDERIFYVRSGTRARVIEEGPYLLDNVRLLRVNLLNGSAAGRTVSVPSSMIAATSE